MAATGLDPTTLYEDHHGMVYRLAYRWLPKFPLGAKLDVEDLAQEAFVELLKAAPSYKPERGSPSTFVGIVVRNRYYHMLSRNYRRWNASKAMDPACFDALDEEGSHTQPSAEWLQVDPEQEVLDALSDCLRAGRIVVRNRYRRLKVSDLQTPPTFVRDGCPQTVQCPNVLVARATHCKAE